VVDARTELAAETGVERKKAGALKDSLAAYAVLQHGSTAASCVGCSFLAHDCGATFRYLSGDFSCGQGGIAVASWSDKPEVGVHCRFRMTLYRAMIALVQCVEQLYQPKP
jgi:hypothetical protein